MSGLAQSGEASWARLAALCETLDSQTVLLRTPATFRPSESNRQALKAFMAYRPESIHCAWWAEGLWESDPESTDALCTETGLVRVVDPLGLDDDAEIPSGSVAYWRLMGRRGMTGRFTDYEMEQLADMVLNRSNAHIVFTAPSMVGSAGVFSRLIQVERPLPRRRRGLGAWDSATIFRTGSGRTGWLNTWGRVA